RAEHVSEDTVVRVDVVLAGRGDLERIREIAQVIGLAGGKIATNVVDRHHRLLEDVLAGDVVLAEPVVIEPAVVPLARDRDVLTHSHFVDVERRVDAYAATLEPRKGGGPFLIEVVEG